ncbi:MAG: arsenic efflux protein [Ignavibacteriaceae bacterium]|nr:arsenic efflux protein [Ignavibacteriaceae bacterium]
MHQNSGIADILLGSLAETYLMIPVLFLLYFVLEYFSHTKQLDIVSKLKISGPLGPLAGTLLGIIPQCGMSVFVTTLYLSKRVTLGTLIATYLATSDEALPVLIANSGQENTILYIVGLKILIGTITGYAVDLLLNKKMYEGEPPAVNSSHAVEIKHELEKTKYKEIAIHTLKRTLRIYFWVLLVTIALSFLLYFADGERLISSVHSHPNIQVIFAALFGLIPNCAASIAIAEAFLHTGLSIGATVAGLSTGAGFGPIVLFKDGNLKFAFQALLISLVAAIFWGYIINYYF